MRQGIRFDPPRVELGGELRWLLWRAFGPADQPLPGGIELRVDLLKRLADSFDLASRVAARTHTEILEIELGPETARVFRRRHADAAARSLIVHQVCREIADLGRELEIPLIFLKGAALGLGEFTRAGSRNLGDIDVLAPEGGARRLQEALIDGGCDPLRSPESEHQLQFLRHPSKLGIEIHRLVPGVRLDGKSSASADGLIERGLVRPAPGLGGSCYVPSDAVLLAHVLVHGIAQHGLAPDAYPMPRMLADVQDLRAGDEVWATAHGWIESEVSREEMEAVAELARRLEAGEDPSGIAGAEGPAGVVLRHLVGGLTDESYARSMKFRGLVATPKDMGRPRGFVKTLRTALLPTRAQIDILYGRPKTGLGYLGWRLWRPFDLVVRTFRYGWAWIGQRTRRQR